MPVGVSGVTWGMFYVNGVRTEKEGTARAPERCTLDAKCYVTGGRGTVEGLQEQHPRGDTKAGEVCAPSLIWSRESW